MTTTIPASFVPETRFGKWFLRTQTWNVHVVQRALTDLERLLQANTRYPVMLDIGSGYGHALLELARRFNPEQLIALDADPDLPTQIQPVLKDCPCPVQLLQGDAAAIPLPDQSVDLVFCHQTFHHLVDQEAAMREFFRVLKPGGVLLFAESTKAYIHSWIIRLLFRHPMDAQKTADEYIGMIHTVGFDLPAARISLPYLWWSRPDLGFLEWIGLPLPQQREETLVNAVAIRPL